MQKSEIIIPNYKSNENKMDTSDFPGDLIKYISNWLDYESYRRFSLINKKTNDYLLESGFLIHKFNIPEDKKDRMKYLRYTQRYLNLCKIKKVAPPYKDGMLTYSFYQCHSNYYLQNEYDHMNITIKGLGMIEEIYGKFRGLMFMFSFLNTKKCDDDDFINKYILNSDNPKFNFGFNILMTFGNYLIIQCVFHELVLHFESFEYDNKSFMPIRLCLKADFKCRKVHFLINNEVVCSREVNYRHKKLIPVVGYLEGVEYETSYN